MSWHAWCDEISLQVGMHHCAITVDGRGKHDCRPSISADFGLALKLSDKPSLVGIYPAGHSHIDDFGTAVTPLAIPNENPIVEDFKAGRKESVCIISNYDDVLGFSVFLSQGLIDKVIHLAELALSTGASLGVSLDFMGFGRTREAFEAGSSSIAVEPHHVYLTHPKARD